jgi:hypothetical protein
MLKVCVYLKYGFIEKYNIDTTVEYLIKNFTRKFKTKGIPLNFNDNKYMSNELEKVEIFSENIVFIIERVDSNVS